MRRRAWIVMGLVAALFGAGRAEGQKSEGRMGADSVSLSLSEAVNRAIQESEEVRLARAQVEMASAQVSSARSSVLPQLSANLGYTRTLKSQFSGATRPAIPDSLKFDPDPTAPLSERVTYLENNVGKAATGALGGLFGDLPFGQANAYSATLSGSQLLYSGGRVGAALNIAHSYRESAQLGLTQEEARIQLEVKGAYYQALLAGEMARIAQAGLDQAESFLAQEQLRQTAGAASDLDVMRAEVARDNLRPQLVQARNASDLAMLNLKRLVNLPLDTPVRLVTELEPPQVPDSAAVSPSPELRQAQEAMVRAAEQQVQIREQQVKIARGAFLPSASLSTSYGRQLYPSSAFSFNEPWRTNWTVGVSVSVPIFSGFQRVAGVHQANVELEQSRLQLAQLRESTQLQYQQAKAEKERALAAIQARQRTVDVAQRVYDLTVLRYDRGLATQLEVSDSRLSLLQAQTNLAQAISDYYTADVTQAANAPSGAGGASGAAAGSAASAQAAQAASAQATSGPAPAQAGGSPTGFQ